MYPIVATWADLPHWQGDSALDCYVTEDTGMLYCPHWRGGYPPEGYGFPLLKGPVGAPTPLPERWWDEKAWEEA